MHRRHRSLAVLTVTVALGLAVFPGCGRAPEEPARGPDETVTEPNVIFTPGPTPRVRLSTLEAPQRSPEIGITLSAVPPGLVITSNEDLWMELTDSARLTLQYTLLALPPEAEGVDPADVGRYESLLPSYSSRKPNDSGVVETRLGTARWATGTYLEDDDELVDVRVFAPHPTGRGTLVVYSACPRGVASVEERIAVIKDLLSHVS